MGKLRSKSYYYGDGGDRNSEMSKMDKEISMRTVKQKNQDVVVVSVPHADMSNANYFFFRNERIDAINAFFKSPIQFHKLDSQVSMSGID